MTIKASGSSLSFTEIATEFGYSTDNKLGNYRVTYDNTPQGGSFSNLPLDAGIPQSGAISFSEFYSKQLNIVVQGYTPGHGVISWANKSATGVYDDGEVQMIGGYKEKPARNVAGWQGGKTVKINVNRVIGSAMPGSNEYYKCALKTGSWPSETTLSVDVGGEGVITGQGGGGGNGGSPGATGGTGENGSSALGIQHSPISVNVAAGGRIQNGYGGGGGGGGAVRDPNKEGEDKYYGGGGGGGGAGYPYGGGGSGAYGNNGSGTPGQGSSVEVAGAGGPGGYNGAGGRGGDVNAAQTSGGVGPGSGRVGETGPGGPHGGNGDAIRATMAQAGNVNISASGEIRGDQHYSVAPGTIT